MSDKFTIQQLTEINESIEKTADSDMPFVKHDDEDVITVIGDPNNIENIKMDYVIKFRYNKAEFTEIPKNAETVGDMVILTYKFPDVFVNPQEDLKVMEAAVKIMPYFDEYLRQSDERDAEIDELGKKYGVNIKVDSKDRTLQINSNDKEIVQKVEEEYKEIERKFSMELIHFYNYAGDDIRDGVYDFVATLLNIGREERNHMMGYSVITAFFQSCEQCPYIWNEAQVLFGV